MPVARTTGPTRCSCRIVPGPNALTSQGYDVRSILSTPVSPPAGTPREIVNILSAAAKKAAETDEFKTKTAAVSATPRYMGPDDLGSYWDEMEVELRGLIGMVRQP